MTEFLKSIVIPSLDINFVAHSKEEFDANTDETLVALSTIRCKVTQAKSYSTHEWMTDYG